MTGFSGTESKCTSCCGVKEARQTSFSGRERLNRLVLVGQTDRTDWFKGDKCIKGHVIVGEAKRG